MTPEECIVDAPHRPDEWRACSFPERSLAQNGACVNPRCRACRLAVAATLRNGGDDGRVWDETSSGLATDLLGLARVVAEEEDDPVLLAAVEYAEGHR